MKNNLYCVLIFFVGLALFVLASRSLREKDAFDYTPNIVSIKGSPYGKVLAFALQGPIDVYWHQGASHSDSESNASEKEKGEDGDQTKSDDENSHGEEIVERNVNLPIRLRGKDHIKKMIGASHRNTRGKPLSAEHQKFLQGVTEDKVRFSYELDPKNYTNYSNYHFFLAHSNLGHREADELGALELSKKTLELCKRDLVDPASWLTASLAAYDISYGMTHEYDKYSHKEHMEQLAEIEYCNMKYEEVCDQAIVEKRIYSLAKIKEMNARYRFLVKLKEAHAVYLNKKANN